LRQASLPLSKLLDGFELYPQVLVNVKVKNKKAVGNDPDVISAIKNAEKELGNSGRILVRESGTEPVIRVMAEAATKEECTKHVYSVVNIIKGKGYAV